MVEEYPRTGSFAERLDTALRARNKTQTWLAEQLDISDQAITKWKRTEQISRDNAMAMCRVLDVNPLWLLEGTGTGPAVEMRDIGKAPEGRVPVVAYAQLGDEGYFVELEYPTGHGSGYVRFTSSDPNAYAVGCRGQSMKPRIKDGEFACIEPNHSIKAGDEVLVRDKNDRVMVKEWAYTRDDQVTLLSVNEAHGKIVIPTAQVAVMHYVADIAKRERYEQS